MGRMLLLIGFLVLIVAGFGPPRVASAQEYNRTITVYASVPEQRAVYLDESGNILRIAGNTAKNIVPRVFDSNNNPVPITPAIQLQYDNFLKWHNNHLDAGKVYSVNPIAISAAPNTQTIDISGNLTLGDLKIH